MVATRKCVETRSSNRDRQSELTASNQRIHRSGAPNGSIVLEVVNVRCAVSSLTVFVVRHFVGLQSLIEWSALSTPIRTSYYENSV
jgi:hypothetical protein